MKAKAFEIIEIPNRTEKPRERYRAYDGAGQGFGLSCRTRFDGIRIRIYRYN